METAAVTGQPDLSSAFLVLLGPPCAGKSTLVGTILSDHPGLGHFAVRRQFVEEKRRESDLWQAAAASQEKGTWIPDQVVIEAFVRRLDAQLPGGVLIEGLPANAPQARMLQQAMRSRDLGIGAILYLDVPDDVCMSRMRGREVCVACDGGISQAELSAAAPDRCARCGTPLTRRLDDAEVAFAERLRLHRHHIEGILSTFGEDRVVTLDGTSAPDVVVDSARKSLAEAGSWI